MSDRKKKAAAEKKRLEEEMEDVKQSAEVRKKPFVSFPLQLTKSYTQQGLF